MLKKIKKAIKKVLKMLPLKNIIIFESVPDLSDNTMPVFEELVKRGYNRKYKMIWLCIKPPRKDYPKIHNVKYIYFQKHKYLFLYYEYCSKVTICCNRFVGVDRKGQTSYYLCHGIPLKETRDYYYLPSYITYGISSSEYVSAIFSYSLRRNVNDFYVLGYPRNDLLTDSHIPLSDYLGKYKKYIVWYPTVKQFLSGRKTGSIHPIPIIHDTENALKLNKIAAENDVLIIVKPHFAQITDNIKKIDLSHIKFIDDDFFKENGIAPYRFVGSCDALISDYSSVYYDYLLCDKPIGLIWEDIEEYKKNPGLIKDYEYLCSGAEKIYSTDELLSFVCRVANETDDLHDKRNEICKLVHCYSDGNSTDRVTDFIISKGKL